MEDPQQWLEDHGDVLYAYAWRRVGDVQRAEDLVQETLLAAWKHRDQFKQQAKPRTWLIAILKRKIIDDRRKQHDNVSLNVLDQPEPVETFNRRGRWVKPKPQAWNTPPDAEMLSRELWDILHRCIDELPEKLGLAFKLREIGEKDTQECCKQLGVSPSNLAVRLHRARLSLRRCMQAKWFHPDQRS